MDSVCSKTRSGDTIVVEVHSFFCDFGEFVRILSERACVRQGILGLYSYVLHNNTVT
jgi:hypothetical protein